MSLAPETPRDTIAAIATALGEAAIGVVRVSGSRAWAIARSLAPSLPATPQGHRAWVRRLRHRGVVLDEAVILAFVAPRSFTGEDVVELQCHGGAATLRVVLGAVVELGARVAEPGEMSRRALLNGRLDLVQVEAIADVIHARGEAARLLAQAHLAGSLSGVLAELSEALVSVLMLVEATIDFSSEEHVYALAGEDVAARLDPILAEVGRLLGTWDAGRLRHDGVAVAIAGSPNAGKSSLLNRLLGTDRAIVSEIAGTTRDTVEDSLLIGGIEFRIVDTAGLRETSDRIEALGIERTRAAIARADIVIWVVGTDDGGLDEAASISHHTPVGILWNKLDVREPPAAPPAWASESLAVSLTRGDGCDQLLPWLECLATHAGLRLDEDTQLITRARHREALTDALAALSRAREAAAAGVEPDCYALDLREAVDALGRLTGAVTSDEILNRIFAGFCIGK